MTRHDRLLRHCEDSKIQAKQQKQQMRNLEQLYVNMEEMSNSVAQIANSIDRMTEDIKDITTATTRNSSYIHNLANCQRLVNSG